MKFKLGIINELNRKNLDMEKEPNKVIRISCKDMNFIAYPMLIGALACAINTVKGLPYAEGKETFIENFNKATSNVFQLDTDDEHGTLRILLRKGDGHFGYFCFELVDGKFDVVNFLNKNKSMFY